jgi:hypothetical protein
MIAQIAAIASPYFWGNYVENELLEGCAPSMGDNYLTIAPDIPNTRPRVLDIDGAALHNCGGLRMFWL